MKQKMDDLKKVKLIYSGELLLFSLVFLVVGLLEILNVIGVNDVFRYIFMWATPFGAAFIIINLIWTIKSEKKRKKSSLLDVISVTPMAIYFIVIDTIMFINYNALEKIIYQYFIGSALLAFSVIYLIQGIYHWYHPLPSLLEELEQERIAKITYKVLEKKEDGSVIALHLDTNKKYLFKKEDNIQENVDELFCLDNYKDVTPEEYKEETK